MYPEKITVEVTAEDINNGRRGVCSSCAISLAASRLFLNQNIRTARLLSIVNSNSSTVAEYHLPYEAKVLITDFDNDREVSPLTFIAEKV